MEWNVESRRDDVDMVRSRIGTDSAPKVKQTSGRSMSKKKQCELFVLEVVENSNGDGTPKSTDVEFQKDLFGRLLASRLHPKWITAEDCMQKNTRGNEVFIVLYFSGVVFDHLCSLKCRVYGTVAALTCMLNRERLPKWTHPILSVTLKECIISFTGIDQDVRQTKTDLIMKMNGAVSKDLNDKTTHLVARECNPSSAKYLAATKSSIPVLSMEWVDKAWDAALKGYTVWFGEKDVYNEYKLKIFTGCVITCSGLSSSERMTIAHIVKANGGVFSPEMERNRCTHLLTDKNSGEKYRKAREWGWDCVKIVRVKWLDKCVQKGMRLQERLYEPKFHAVAKTSTPEADGVFAAHFDVSSISGLRQPTVASRSDRTLSPLLGSSSLHGQLKGAITDVAKCTNMSSDTSALRQRSSLCRNFSSRSIEEMSALDPIKAIGLAADVAYDCLELKEISSTVSVVTCQWLIECGKQQKMVAEKEFLHPLVYDNSSAKRNPSSTRNDQSSNGMHPDTSKSSNGASKVVLKSTDQRDVSAVHAKLNEVGRITILYASRKETVVLQAPPVEEKGAGGTKENASCWKEQRTKEPDLSKLFAGLSFGIDRFEEAVAEDLELTIVDLGGKYELDKLRRVNYLLLPLLHYGPVDEIVDLNADNVVSAHWMHDCIDRGEVLDPNGHPLYRPLSASLDSPIFTGCVVALSSMGRPEKETYTELLKTFGAVVQNRLVKRGDVGAQFQRNTHVVTCEASERTVCSPSGDCVILQDPAKETANHDDHHGSDGDVVIIETPLNKRLKTLYGDTSQSMGSPAVDTPSRFLDPNTKFIPRFDLRDAYAVVDALHSCRTSSLSTDGANWSESMVGRVLEEAATKTAVMPVREPTQARRLTRSLGMRIEKEGEESGRRSKNERIDDEPAEEPSQRHMMTEKLASLVASYDDESGTESSNSAKNVAVECDSKRKRQVIDSAVNSDAATSSKRNAQKIFHENAIGWDEASHLCGYHLLTVNGARCEI
ncbi:unnamed protein product [Toxocara canis]|uniref:DNA topoisomerase 2-binding protein 1 n=1 Tax=Toxocara canis TaxID=6265 RepID=A0A183V3S5_TOXCA|nr:unnamed protein product [Toxocara canis]